MKQKDIEKTTQSPFLPKDPKDNHTGHRERLKERLVNGDLDSYQTHEIIEMMLYQTHKTCDTNAIAHALLKKFGSLTGVLNADIDELMTIKGVGKNTATLIKNYLMVFRRYKREMIENKKKIISFNDVFNYAYALLVESRREEVVVVCLDNGRNIINVKSWLGSVNKINVLAREIIGFCFNSKAVGVVIAHSHPDGLASPSNDDLMFTKLLYTSLKSIDVTLAEHIIIGNRVFFSFYKEGLLEQYRKEYYKNYQPTAMSAESFVLQGGYLL